MISQYLDFFAPDFQVLSKPYITGNIINSSFMYKSHDLMTGFVLQGHTCPSSVRNGPYPSVLPCAVPQSAGSDRSVFGELLVIFSETLQSGCADRRRRCKPKQTKAHTPQSRTQTDDV